MEIRILHRSLSLCPTFQCQVTLFFFCCFSRIDVSHRFCNCFKDFDAEEFATLSLPLSFRLVRRVFKGPDPFQRNRTFKDVGVRRGDETETETKKKERKKEKKKTARFYARPVSNWRRQTLDEEKRQQNVRNIFSARSVKEIKDFLRFNRIVQSYIDFQGAKTRKT